MTFSLDSDRVQWSTNARIRLVSLFTDVTFHYKGDSKDKGTVDAPLRSWWSPQKSLKNIFSIEVWISALYRVSFDDGSLKLKFSDKAPLMRTFFEFIYLIEIISKANIYKINPSVPTTATVAVLPLWGSIVRVLEEVETNGYPSKFGPTILHKLISLQKFKLKIIISYEQKCEARIWFFSHFSCLRSNSLKNIVKTMLDPVYLSIRMCLK